MKIILAACLIVLSSAKVNPTRSDKLDWMEMNELSSLLETETKPVLIDLYTNWCYWCKVMDKKTYTNARVIGYINEHFYAVKLNAESKEMIYWKEKEYQYNVNYKINDFALYATSGQLGFPATIIIPDSNSEPISIPGFLEPKEIEPILKYFGEGVYKTQSYMVYKSTFKSTW
jgi:thioredoxin-related protein